MKELTNILLFLIPKANVEFVLEDYTIRQVMEKMDFHHYTAIPVLTRDGKYLETISDSDLLKTIKDNKLNWEKSMEIKIKDVDLIRNIKPIKVDKNIFELIDLIENQNFVPVIDDMEHFIGIITRKSVIEYMTRKIDFTK